MNLKQILLNDFSNLDLFQFVNNVNERTRLTLSYVSLLLASTVLSTLGLLMENVPVVIGGMIISPLMWPIIKTSLGVCYERIEYIRQALTLLFASIIISITSGILITLISPLQYLNNTIIALANPTLLDLIIALVAGAVASVSLIQPKINDSLAGVAIATSLMPPLCNVGIAIALNRPDLSWKSLTLFFVHVLSIIFIAIVIFTSAGLRSSARRGIIKQRTLILLTAVLVILSFPLFVFMRNYALSSSAIVTVQNVLERDLGTLTKDFQVSEINTELTRRNGEEILSINATVVLPENISLDFQRQQDIVQELEDELERPVDLSMVITRTITVISEADQEVQQRKDQMRDYVFEYITGFSESSFIETLDITYLPSEQSNWDVDLKISSDPSIQFSEADRKNLESELEFLVSDTVELAMTIFPRINLISEDQGESEAFSRRLRSQVYQTVESLNEDITINSVKIITNDPNDGVAIRVDLTAPNYVTINQDDIAILARDIERELEGINNTAKLYVNIVESRGFTTSLRTGLFTVQDNEIFIDEDSEQESETNSRSNR